MQTFYIWLSLLERNIIIHHVYYEANFSIIDMLLIITCSQLTIKMFRHIYPF